MKKDIKYKLVKVSKKDISRLIRYKEGIIYMYSKDLVEDERKRIDEYVINSVNETLKDYFNIIVDDKVIGSVIIINLRRGKLLDEIYLEKEFRNNGVGTDIIRKIIENNKSVYLFTCELIKAVIIYKIVYFNISFIWNFGLLNVQYLLIINPTIEPQINDNVFATVLSIPNIIKILYVKKSTITAVPPPTRNFKISFLSNLLKSTIF